MTHTTPPERIIALKASLPEGEQIVWFATKRSTFCAVDNAAMRDLEVSYTLTTTHEAALAAKDARIAELEGALRPFVEEDWDDLDPWERERVFHNGENALLDPLKPLSDAGQAWDADGEAILNQNTQTGD